jgi:thymidine kinase
MLNVDPTLVVYCGPMFSGKTSRLLLDLERFKHQRKRVTVVKPAIDDRYSVAEVVSHSNWRHPAIIVRNGPEILEALTKLEEPPDVVAVDEAFMIPGSAKVLVWLFRTGISVVVSTLDLSSNGKPFDEVVELLPWATHIEKCPAVCVECGRDAFYTYKRQTNDDEIEVGGFELYEPRCRFCHPSIDLRPNIRR